MTSEGLYASDLVQRGVQHVRDYSLLRDRETQVLRELGYTDEDLAYYKLDPVDKATKHKNAEREKTRLARVARAALDGDD